MQPTNGQERFLSVRQGFSFPRVSLSSLAQLRTRAFDQKFTAHGRFLGAQSVSAARGPPPGEVSWHRGVFARAFFRRRKCHPQAGTAARTKPRSFSCKRGVMLRVRLLPTTDSCVKSPAIQKSRRTVVRSPGERRRRPPAPLPVVRSSTALQTDAPAAPVSAGGSMAKLTQRG